MKTCQVERNTLFCKAAFAPPDRSNDRLIMDDAREMLELVRSGEMVKNREVV